MLKLGQIYVKVDSLGQLLLNRICKFSIQRNMDGWMDGWTDALTLERNGPAMLTGGQVYIDMNRVMVYINEV